MGHQYKNDFQTPKPVAKYMVSFVGIVESIQFLNYR